MSNYGLISKVDAWVLEETLRRIDFYLPPSETLYVCEVGVYAGETGNGIREFLKGLGRNCFITGIDNNRDGEKLRFDYDRLIIGDSRYVYNQIDDKSQHLVIIDGEHTFPAVVSDFYCYAPKIKDSGYMAFHDTGRHIDPSSGWQGVGSNIDPDMCLGGVRKALQRIGILNSSQFDPELVFADHILENWDCIFDDADTNDSAGGFCVFQKYF